MNYPRTIILVLLLSLLSVFCFAQSGFRIEFSSGASFNSSSKGVFRNWDNGWTLGGGATYQVGTSIELLATTSYSHFSYISKSLELVAPDVVGWRQSVEGEASNVIEAAVGVRFVESTSFINPFLAVRTGFYRFDVGEVVISTWMDSNPQNVSRSVYRGTGNTTTKGFVAIGAGFSVPVDSNIRITLESHLAQTLDSNESFVPVLLSIQFGL